MSQLTKGKKRAIVIACIAVGLAVFIVAWLMLCGYLWTWGPFSSLADIRMRKLAGNGEEYALETVEPLDGSPLEGLDILYLGSSVTYGASSLGTAFPEYIAARNGTDYLKEAVSGTTLVEEGLNSYVTRLKKVDKARAFDLVICQLSTNDATQKKELGTPGAGDDTHTVCGAIEYIIDYARETWNCPVVFYTNSYYENERYAAMVDALHTIAENEDIGVIDLYSDEAFNDITEEQRALYMADSIHPTRAGYLLWWTPAMEEYLYSYIG